MKRAWLGLLAGLLLRGCGGDYAYAQTTPLVVATTVSCATSVDGSVVGLPNPLSPPIVSAQYTGSLAAGNYFTVIAWYDAAGHVTLVGPEVQRQLTATGTLQVNLPSAGMPAGAVGMKIYIGTSSGSETLQGSTTGSATFSQSTSLTTGTAIPSTNTTLCQIVANDAGWPTGTGYQVSMTSPGGTTLPGYPMQWQLLGPGQTINLGQGLPLYNGMVQYPIPLLANPYNHAGQSVSGPLSLSGYALTQVLKIGVGTQVPAWGIDVEGTGLNSEINANGGYLVNGNGGTVGQCLASDGTAFDTPVACITSIGNLYYQTVKSNGTAQNQRVALNFSPRFALSDSSSPSQTTVDLTMTGVTPGAYTSPSSFTVDAYGRVTAITASSAANRTCNTYGCYVELADGTLQMWGQTGSCGSGSNNDCTVSVTFPTSFSTTTNLAVVFGASTSNTGASEGNIITMAENVSTSSFTARFGSMVYVGGGGNTIDPSVKAYWFAIGH